MSKFRENKKDIAGINFTTLILCTIIMLSFMVHIFSFTVSTSIYIIVLLLFTFIFAFVRPKIRIEKNIYSAIWVLAIFVAVLCLLHSSREANSIFDVLCLFCCMLITLFYCKNSKDYLRSIRFIYIITLFFAAGVLLQRFLPQIYNTILNVFPSDFATAVKTGTDDLASSGKRGFTTNSGTSAGYICSGIIALISLGHRNARSKVVYYVILAFLLISLLFTGKRGPALFLVLTLFLRYILPERGNSRMRKYWIGFLIILSLTVLYSAFGSYFANIPLVREITESINGLVLGDDVSSLRLSLYGWALTLFKKNPWIGIGWGDYRNTVAGNITTYKALDVHNIYLQLLCETGIIGFIVFAVLFAVFWITTKNAYCSIAKSTDENYLSWLPLLSFSFSYQSFFLLYGLTGNPLYDQHYQILYGISCAITLAYVNYRKWFSFENIYG